MRIGIDARKVADWTKMPGSRKLTYETPAGSELLIAPPKT